MNIENMVKSCMELFNFIKKEPLGFDGSMNFYGYCEGDPVNFVDVSGLNANLKNLNKIRKLYKIKDLTYNKPFSIIDSFKYGVSRINILGGALIISGDVYNLILDYLDFMETGLFDFTRDYMIYKMIRIVYKETSNSFKYWGLDKNLENLGSFICSFPNSYKNFTNKYFYHPFMKIGESFADRKYNFQKNIKSIFKKNRNFFETFSWAF